MIPLQQQLYSKETQNKDMESKLNLIPYLRQLRQQVLSNINTGKGLTKVKFDNSLNLTVLVQNTISDKLSVSVGALIPVKKPKATNEGETSPIVKNKVGLQLYFNI